MVHRTLSWFVPPDSTTHPKPPDWLMVSLSLLAVLYSVMPLLAVRLPSAIEILFALVGLYTLFRYGKGLRWTLPVKLMAVSVVVLVISWTFMMLDHPDLARSGPSLEDYLDKFFFLFIALVVAGVERRALIYLGVFALFVLLMPWLSGEGSGEIATGLKGIRVDFGINPIRTGLLFGAVFLGLVCFAHRMFLVPRFSPLRFCVWALLVIYCLTIVIITQSRTAMVALIPGVVVAVALFLSLSPITSRFKVLVLAALIAGSAVALWASYMTGMNDLVEQRFDQEAAVVDQLLSGNVDDVPKTSWGIRVRLLTSGIESFLERPLTGWGYRAGEIVLDKEGLRQGNGEVFSQAHNAYLEAALRYGVGGAVILLMLLAWALRGSWRSWKGQRMSFDMLLFLGATLSYFMVANLFDGLLFQTEGVLLFNVLMGVAGSYIFYQGHDRPDPEATHDNPA